MTKSQNWRQYEVLGDQVLQVKVCMMVGYGPNEGDGEKRDRFWSNMDGVLDRVVNRYRLCILDLNGWIGDRMRV